MVVLLAAAVVALGAWVVVDQTGTTGDDSQTLVNDLRSAWSTYDAKAITSLYAPNAVVTEADGTADTGIDAILGALGGFKLLGLSVVPVGKVAVNGEYTATFVRFSDGDEALTLLQVKNGTIVRHWDGARPDGTARQRAGELMRTERARSPAGPPAPVCIGCTLSTTPSSGAQPSSRASAPSLFAASRAATLYPSASVG